jgi:hypothetical protein
VSAAIRGHLADADLVYFYRFLKVIAEEGVPVVPFDQDKWVIELRESERPVEVSLAMSRGARTGFMHYLRTLPPEMLERKTFAMTDASRERRHDRDGFRRARRQARAASLVPARSDPRREVVGAEEVTRLRGIAIARPIDG